MLPEGKYNLELNLPGDGRIFLNFWDSIHGYDVMAELKDGKLILDTSISEREISIQEYLQIVISAINQRNA
jgi:hypothetical protein